jgi:hypothetical protein
MEDPDTKPHNYSHLIFDKGNKICAVEKTALPHTVLGKLDFQLQRLKLDPSLSPWTSISSKWIKKLNVKSLN